MNIEADAASLAVDSDADLAVLRLEVARLGRALARSEEVNARHAFNSREGDHRIKNSLQIVSSLLLLQARREQGVSARDALCVAAGRVVSIARIHDALQESDGRDSVNLGAALQTMCNALQEIAGDPRRVAIVVDVDPIHAPVAVAQPILLAVNELVLNALRHAFPDALSGAISVSATKADGEMRIVVSDDGAGLPPDHAEGRGYGMKLVRMLAGQIGGKLQVVSNAGTQFTLTAPA